MKMLKPESTVFEKVALELACTWYEIGRGQGMTSKWKDAKSYGRANFERFLPKALEYCISMLGRDDIPALMKAEIYDELMRRNNDPDLNIATGNTLPNIQIEKLMEMLPKQDRTVDIIDKAVKGINPYLKVN